MDSRVEEVVRACGLQRHLAAFDRERISWPALIELAEDDLAHLGLAMGQSSP